MNFMFALHHDGDRVVLSDFMSANSSNCSSPFDEQTYRIIAAVRAGSGLLAFMFSLFALFVVVLFKKYQTFWQRLILYSNVSTTLYGLSVVLLRVDYIESNAETMRFCVFAGFFHQYSNWTVLMSILCYHLSLCVKVILAKDLSGRLEAPYFIVIFFAHLAFNWIPFLHFTYGLAGAWCWIRDTNGDCSHSLFGFILRYTIWYVPLYSVVLTVLVGYVASWVVATRRRKSWEGRYNADVDDRKRDLQRDMSVLLGVPLVLILINIPTFVNAIHDAIDPERPLLAFWILHAFFSPLPFGVLPLLFTLDKETRQKLRARNVGRALRTLCSSSPVYNYDVKVALDSSYQSLN